MGEAIVYIQSGQRHSTYLFQIRLLNLSSETNVCLSPVRRAKLPSILHDMMEEEPRITNRFWYVRRLDKLLVAHFRGRLWAAAFCPFWLATRAVSSTSQCPGGAQKSSNP